MYQFIRLFCAVGAVSVAITSAQSCNFSPKTTHHDGTPANVYLEKNSLNCTSNLPEAPLETCDVDDFDVFFSPLAVFPTGRPIAWPYIDLNVTVIPKVFASDIFVQLECLSSSNNGNVYCKNHTFLTHDDIFAWPCRQHTILSDEKDVKLPYTFEHACFRMHGSSQYRMNVTLLPQKCHLSYIVAMPPIYQVNRRIKQILYDVSVDPTKYKVEWSPMVTVDVNSPDAVIVRFHRGNESAEVTVSVFTKETETNLTLHEKKVLLPPETTAIFAAPAGDYKAFIYVDHPYCVLDCDDKPGCIPCDNTSVDFTLHEHKLHGIHRFKHYALVVIEVVCYILVVLFVIGLLVALAIYIYCKFIQPRILLRRPPQAFAMTEIPDVLIVYTDDCPEHTASVVAFAELLESHANAKVWIDTKDLLNHSVKPSIWLMRAIAEVKFIILIFSAASKQVIAGEALPQRRPFPDLFSPAVRAVTTRINELTSRNGVDLTRKPLKPDSADALNRFIVARFAYTNPSAIPEFFSLVKCRHIVIPQDLGRLFGYLHEVDAPSDKAIIEIDADTTYLKQSMQRFAEYAHDNPEWLKDRMTQSETVHHDPREFERLPLNNITEATTVDELVQHYEHLHKPDDDDDEEGSHVADTGVAVSSEKFELLGSMNDISSDSD